MEYGPKDGSFVLTLSLKTSEHHMRYLDRVFRVANAMYNALVADRLRALREVEKTREWKKTQSLIAARYREIEAILPKGSKEDAEKKLTPAQRRELARLRKDKKRLADRRSTILFEAGFTDAAFQSRMKRYRASYARLIGSPVAQKLATAVWRKFKAYLYGGGKQVRFRPWAQNLSIEAKRNGISIAFDSKALRVNKMDIPVIVPNKPYEREALSHDVAFCRITRIPWKDGRWRYRLQLVLKGDPPRKHKAGTGRVGLDIGTQTLGWAAEDKVGLDVLAPGAVTPEHGLWLVNRAIDRSRRATNPDMFAPDGQIIPKDRLAPQLLDARGRRKWRDSRRKRRLDGKRRYLFAKTARIREQEHNILANKVMAHGCEAYVERMDWKALAKRAKRGLDKNGREKRRRRFGKSIANRAPAKFLAILEKKLEREGGTLAKIDTWKARASQYDLESGAYVKKSLGKRWHVTPSGRRLQRDIFSAYLIKSTNASLDGFDQDMLEAGYERFLKMHDVAMAMAKALAQTTALPASMGIR